MTPTKRGELQKNDIDLNYDDKTLRYHRSKGILDIRDSSKKKYSSWSSQLDLT